MSDHTKIEWTDATWNPATGCDHVSPGCDHCYARRMALRFGGPTGFLPKLHYERLKIPYHWRKPRRVFVCSMGDLFHHEVPEQFVRNVFQVMNENLRHTFQVLTKRPGRAALLSSRLTWTPNIWMGATVESQKQADRLVPLRNIPAAVRFVSCEPMLSSIALDLRGIGWVICGGETGPGAREMSIAWPLSLLVQCQKAGVPFFFKRWGGNAADRNSRLLANQTYYEMPSGWRAK